jgi:excisionase family DNA binding protein
MSDQVTAGPWLDAAQLAEYLAIPVRGIRELERRGVLPGHRLGRSVRFGLREIDALLRRRRQPTLDELAVAAVEIPSGPIGPLWTPERAGEHLGLPSTEALAQRARRRQVPVYRVSERILRYRRIELDRLLGRDR